MRPKKFMVDGLKYLKRLRPIRHFVLKNGTWFEGRARFNDYPNAIYWRRKHRPQVRECFQNAQQFCLAHPEARYFEGFYLIFETPDAHAWVVMEDGRVLDFTVEAVLQKARKDKGEVYVRPPRYLGVEIPYNQLAELHALVERNEPILELYKASLKRRRE